VTAVATELFEEKATLFADVAVPVPVPRFFTYRVPAAMNEHVKVGHRVIVPFGQKKIVTGIVMALHERPPREHEAKYLFEVLDSYEIVYEPQLRLYQWMADYYLCAFGEVLNAALPAGLKLSSESIVQLNPAFDRETTAHAFSEKERLLLAHLANGTLNYTEVAKLLNTKHIYALIKSLLLKEAILLVEEVRDKYKPKTQKRVRLTREQSSKAAIGKVFEWVASHPKQEELLLRFLQELPVLQHPEKNIHGIARAALLEGLSDSAYKTLIKKGVLEEFEVIVPRMAVEKSFVAPALLLSEKQEAIRNQILTHFETKNTVLLQGVTGSGKTEIYIDLIKRALEGGSQVLYLLPEIALTTQIVQRLAKMVGGEVGVYHSRFSDNERVEVWNNVLLGKVKFVIGVRSAVFLPFDNLGLIIVDEEHEGSYKQQDPAPRYHARDTALVLAHQHHAKVVLGSATPSLESYQQARSGRYGFCELTERYGDAALPEIVFANTAQEKQQKTTKGEFTSRLLNEIRDTLGQGQQVILFQNRRGHSPLVQCQDCHWMPRCVQCDVSLTYHQYKHALVCHYCGYREEMPHQCPSCSSQRILTLGYGTEKLEEELKLHFSESTIQRMDLETTRSKTGYESIIEAFEKGDTHILVGTQMVTKGLDFDRVNLVGIFDADRMLHFPDFRSHERAFQLMVQVSGRAGRRAKRGKVVIQTHQPDHPVFRYVMTHDVKGFLENELPDRHSYFYPPFTRLIEITLRHTDKKTVREAADQFCMHIQRQLKGLRLVGPGEPMVNKVRNEYLRNILLKIPRESGHLTEIKDTLRQLADGIRQQEGNRNLKIVFDVDPM
jgi:primosomal protein N' (replication factor Y)